MSSKINSFANIDYELQDFISIRIPYGVMKLLLSIVISYIAIKLFLFGLSDINDLANIWIFFLADYLIFILTDPDKYIFLDCHATIRRI